jgi:two-component sensor histidine kinase
MSCYRLRAQALPSDDAVESVAHLHLDPLPRVAQTARRFVRDRLPAVSEETTDTLMLLTSELVTNAVIHARTAIELGVTVTSTAVLVTVHDEDLGAAPEPAQGREGGRGLGLVRALSDASATEQHAGHGKTAWFRVARDEAVSGA